MFPLSGVCVNWVKTVSFISAKNGVPLLSHKNLKKCSLLFGKFSLLSVLFVSVITFSEPQSDSLAGVQ